MNTKRKILITGAEGFIGKNLYYYLYENGYQDLLTYDIHDTVDSLSEMLRQCDVVFHLAGVNRPKREEEFVQGNTDFTASIIDSLLKRENKPLIVMSSSIQATMENPYGKSKLYAEESIEQYAKAGGTGVIFRLPNVFGKWSRPNYNSAVATFCYNIGRGEDINISDPKRDVELVYIDDVVSAFFNVLNIPLTPGIHRPSIAQVKVISLGDLTRQIYSMKNMRNDLMLPDFSDAFTKNLYATYLSFLPTNEFGYFLSKREDQRGSLAELLKSPNIGQIFVSRTRPGYTRGNHYHNTKVEKFCVLEGTAIIRFRNIANSTVIEYPVKGDEYRVLDIPPGYTHSIENIGDRDCIVLFWASEIFNQSNPDTYQSPVIENKF